MNSASGTSEMIQHYLVLQLLIDEIMDTDVGSDENGGKLYYNIQFNLASYFSRHNLVYSGTDKVPKLPIAQLNRIPKAADTIATTAK